MKATTGELMLVLKFTDADLHANRNGKLSVTQSAQLKRDKQRIALIGLGLFFVFVLVSTGLIFSGQRSQNDVAFVGGFVLIMANALTVGILGREYMRLDGDQRLGSVDALAGPVERVILRGRRSDRYLLRIEGEDINVNSETLACFEHRARYRIYRTQRAQVLLSAELLA